METACCVFVHADRHCWMQTDKKSFSCQPVGYQPGCGLFFNDCDAKICRNNKTSKLTCTRRRETKLDSKARRPTKERCRNQCVKHDNTVADECALIDNSNQDKNSPHVSTAPCAKQ